MKIVFNKSFTLLVFLVTVLWGCEKIEGEATPPAFDATPYIFSKTEANTVITAKNEVKWFFDNLHIDNKYVSFKDPSIKYYTKNVSPNADSDIAYIYQFEGEWFRIERLDYTRIQVILKENQSGVSRTLKVSVRAGNASTDIILTQLGE